MRRSLEWDATFDAIHDAILILDASGRIVRANRAARRFFLLDATDLTGRLCWEVIHGSATPPHDCLFLRVRKNLEKEEMEFQRQGRWHRAVAHPILADDGALEGVIHVISDITEERWTREALAQSERRFRQAMDAARDGIWEWDLRTGRVYYSPAYARMLGYEVAEFGNVVDAWIEHVHPEDRERALEANRRCIENEVPHFEVEFRMRTKHGDWKWILGRGKAVKRDSDGRALILIGTHIDITQLKLSQEKLFVQGWIGTALSTITRMEEGFHLVLDAVIRITGMDCGAVYFVDERNQRLDRIHHVGLSHGLPETMEIGDDTCPIHRLVSKGMPIYTVHGKLNVPTAGTVQEEDLQAVALVPILYEGRVVGCLRLASRSKVHIPSDNRSFLENVAALMGNTYARIAARERLDESIRQYGILFELAGDALFVVRRHDGRIMDANNAASKLLGVSKADLIGQSWGRLWVGDPWQEDWPRDFERAGTTDSPFMQGRLMTRSGEIIPVEISARPLELDNCCVLYINARDIRERLRSEQEKRMLEEQLRLAQKMESVGRVAGGIAHDFNNVLTPILGFAEILTNSLQPEDFRVPYVRSIRDAALKAKDLIGKLLAFSRSQVLEMRAVELKALLEGFHTVLRQTIREDIEIRMSLPRDSIVVRADVGQMEQVLINLAVNAQDAMPSAGTLAIQLESREFLDESDIPVVGLGPGRYAVLTVADTGTGMDSRTLEKIFEPFFTTKPKRKGSGLGLSTVYGIVEQHEGRILATSVPGMGSAFEIYLPQIPETTFAGTSQDAGGTQAFYGSEETILLVEDDDEVRALAHSMLQSMGYYVLEASSPSHALQRVDGLREPPAVLMTSVILPEMSGEDLFGILQSKWPNLKVLYTSGYPEKIEAGMAPNHGDSTILTKPFTVAQLRRKLAAVLER